MTRGSATRAVRRAAGNGTSSDLEARHGLLEHLFRTDDPVACADRALEWLVDHVGAERALCLAVVSDRYLSAIASRGLEMALTIGFTVDLEDERDPLVRALSSSEPIRVHEESELRGVPIARPFFVLPLRHHSGRSERAVGLLLVGPAPADGPGPDIRWLADTLGHKLAGWSSVRLGIDGRVGRERSLANRAALLQDVVDAVSDPILVTDNEGKVLLGNARADWLFASKESDNVGRRRAVELNNLYLSSALASRAIAAETARREVALVDPINGTDILFELLPATIRSSDEGPVVVSILRNVTELGRAAQELAENTARLKVAQADARAERRRLELIIDSVADPIVVTDAEGDIVLLNAPAEKLFTARLETTNEGKKRISANDAHFSSFVSNVLISGGDRRHRGEIGLTDPDTGSQIPVEAISGSIMGERGELTAVVTILHDRREAVERARLYAELEKAKEELEDRIRIATRELADQNEKLRRQALELERASALKSQFLANVSHEFRTPLNALIGSAHILREGIAGKLEAPQRKNVDRIYSNGRNLLEIISSILDITRIEAGRMPIRSARFRLGTLLEEVMSELAPLIGQSKLEVTSEVPREIPPLQTDRQKIKQIVLNLLNNALKFTKEGSIRVTALWDRREDRVAIAVSDTGIGIAEKDQARIFEDFQQVDGSEGREFGGTGLGLSICRRLATMLEGTISVTSELGKGSTFTLTVPRRVRGQG